MEAQTGAQNNSVPEPCRHDGLANHFTVYTTNRQFFGRCGNCGASVGYPEMVLVLLGHTEELAKRVAELEDWRVRHGLGAQ